MRQADAWREGRIKLVRRFQCVCILFIPAGTFRTLMNPIKTTQSAERALAEPVVRWSGGEASPSEAESLLVLDVSWGSIFAVFIRVSAEKCMTLLWLKSHSNQQKIKVSEGNGKGQGRDRMRNQDYRLTRTLVKRPNSARSWDLFSNT